MNKLRALMKKNPGLRDMVSVSWAAGWWGDGRHDGEHGHGRHDGSDGWRPRGKHGTWASRSPCATPGAIATKREAGK